MCICHPCMIKSASSLSILRMEPLCLKEVLALFGVFTDGLRSSRLVAARLELRAMKTSPELSAGAEVKLIEVSTGEWSTSCHGLFPGEGDLHE